MYTLSRYIRAFVLALKLTLRGEKLSPRVQHPLVGWNKQLAVLVDAAYQTAERNGVDKTARQTLKLRLDGRMMSLETVLATIKFHATQEYPSLLQHGLDRDILNTLYASNINDQYWISQLVELNIVEQPAFRAAIIQLQSHLDHVPPMSTIT